MSFLDDLEKLGGVMPIGSESLLPLPESEIAELESLAGNEFPAGYRRFLAEVGGVSFNEDVRFPTIDPLPSDFSRSGLGLVASLYASSQAKAHKTATLRWNIEQSPDYYPENLIAIGHDGGGGKILLDLNPATKGAVLYYPQLSDWFKSDEEDPFRVADSFEDFVRSLRVAAPS